MALAKTTYKGGTFSREMANCLREVDRLTPNIPLVYSQGGFNGTRVAASAGTHSGDAVDISIRGLTTAQVTEALRILRMCGLAAWYRTPAQGFTPHIHAVPNGWGYPSAGAAAQAVSYRAGRNGLARNGRDDGPDGFRTRTWGGYLKANGLTVDGDGKTRPLASKTITAAATAATARKEVIDMTKDELFKALDEYAAQVITGKRGMGVLHNLAAIPWQAGFGRKANTNGTKAEHWNRPMEVIRQAVKR